MTGDINVGGLMNKKKIIVFFFESGFFWRTIDLTVEPFKVIYGLTSPGEYLFIVNDDDRYGKRNLYYVSLSSNG